MFKTDESHIKEIEDALKGFGISKKVIQYARGLYRRVVVNPAIKNTRTTERSLIASIVYIAIRVKSSKPITQTDICYRFKISPMTLRKQYSKVCELLAIDRKRIWEPYKSGSDADDRVQDTDKGSSEPGEQTATQNKDTPQD